MIKRGCLAAVLALCASSAGAIGCGEHETHAPEPLHLDATTIVRRDTEIEREYVCQIRAIRHIEVRAIESGYLRETFIDEGQHVERGQRLFQITPVVYQAEVARSQAEMHLAEVEYQNTRMLREGNVVSPQELAMAQANLERASAQTSLARAHLRFASLDAPFDGIIGRLMVRSGSLLEEGDLLTVLADNSEMWVYFNVSEGEYLTYRATHEVGDPVPVELRLANGEIFDQPGVIQTIEADFNNETGTIAFRAGFPNPNGILRHGGTGEIVMRTTLPHVLLIPQAATFHVLDKVYVYVIGDDERVHAREIQVGMELPHLWVVESGLEEGERVLLDGLRRVHDGDVVEPNLRDPAEVERSLRELPAH